MGERRRSRELALKVLYQMEHSPAAAEDAIELFMANFQASEKHADYARCLVKGIEQHQKDIDEGLDRASRRWKVNRMSQVDRNILRVAAFEMLYGHTPAKVAINEAIELAKRYSATESPGFINAVLDALVDIKGQNI